MQTILINGVEYSQLLDDVRAVIRHEINQSRLHRAAPSAESLETLTIREAASVLNISSAEIHDFKKRGLLTFYKVGGRTHLVKAEVQALQRTPAAPEGPARS